MYQMMKKAGYDIKIKKYWNSNIKQYLKIILNFYIQKRNNILYKIKNLLNLYIKF